MTITMDRSTFLDSGLDIGDEYMIEGHSDKPTRFIIDSVFHGNDEVEIEMSPA